jgi:hypothetical protein
MALLHEKEARQTHFLNFLLNDGVPTSQNAYLVAVRPNGSLCRDIGGFNSPPSLLLGHFPCFCGGVRVSCPAVFHVVPILVHRAVLPKLRLCCGCPATHKKHAQKQQCQQLLHDLILLVIDSLICGENKRMSIPLPQTMHFGGLNLDR